MKNLAQRLGPWALALSITTACGTNNMTDERAQLSMDEAVEQAVNEAADNANIQRDAIIREEETKVKQDLGFSGVETRALSLTNDDITAVTDMHLSSSTDLETKLDEALADSYAQIEEDLKGYPKVAISQAKIQLAEQLSAWALTGERSAEGVNAESANNEALIKAMQQTIDIQNDYIAKLEDIEKKLNSKVSLEQQSKKKLVSVLQGTKSKLNKSLKEKGNLKKQVANYKKKASNNKPKASVSAAVKDYRSAGDLDYRDSYWAKEKSEENGGERQCAKGYVMTGIQCLGKRCDRHRMQCTRIQGRVTHGEWSTYFSEERFGEKIKERSYVTGIKCKGSYCDNKRLKFNKILGHNKEGKCYDTKETSEEGPKLECKKGYSVSGMKCSRGFCDNIKLRCCK